ncbi:MAG: ABC transporter ATP-binding protein [Clostridia bacterium]|nr:ABC transporter ATP-binding protein [Clostridia bacterium]
MLEIIGLSAAYGKKQVLFDINTVIEDGKFIAIIGRNGSGKSTFLSCLASIGRYSGKILLDGQGISELKKRDLAKKISFLPQTLPVTPFTVRETAAFGREPYTDLSGKLTDEDKKAVADALEKCGISNLSEKRMNEISGGERQMAYLAMMLAQDADVLLLDEPTTYMDAPNAREFMKILTEERNRGKSVVAVMHDLTQAVKYADYILLIEEGKAVFFGTKEECLAEKAIESVMCVESHIIEDGKIVFI